MDMVLGTALFVFCVRVAESGESPVMTTLVAAVWAFVYMVVSPVVGRFVTPRNAAGMTAAGSFLAMICSLLCLFDLPLWTLYPAMAFYGIGFAFFFTPFQVFMKTVESDRPQGVAHSTGMYTFSWSMGLACGPFVSGFLWQYYESWQICLAVSGLMAFLSGFGILLLRHHGRKGNYGSMPRPEPECVPDSAAASRESIDYAALPDLAWLGWTASGVGCFAVSILRSYYPFSGNLFGIDKASQGTTIFLVGAIQGVVGLCLCRSRLWMYRALPVVLFGVAGVAGMWFYACSETSLGFNVGSILFGVYSGAFYYYLVFHSLVHPERSSRYVAINETMVGATSIMGPLAAGFLAQAVNPWFPYAAGAILVFCAFVLQGLVHLRIGPQVRKAYRV
jgi:DHA1 family quinolone resistance protein-like MFS transporter